MERIHKEEILNLIIQKLANNIAVFVQAVATARDTATHKDCLGSSKYETMGLEASYLAQGQGVRLLELERSLAYFKQIRLQETTHVELDSYIVLNDEEEKQTSFWIAADSGGLTINYQQQYITVITPQSPLGKVLMGKVVGDDFFLTIAGKEKYFNIASLV